MMVGLGLVTTGLLTRNLGPGVYGGYMLIVSSFIILDAIADFGTKIIGIREMAGEKEQRARVIRDIGVIRVITTGIAFLIGLVVVMNWSVFETVRTEAVLGLIMIWLTSLGGIWEIIYQVEMRMDLKVVQDILFPCLIVVGIWGMRNNLSLISVFEISILARIVSLLVGLGMINKITNYQLLITNYKNNNWIEIKKMWKMAWPMGAYLLLFASYDRGVDSMMIGRFVGLKEVAWYGLAYKIYTTLLQPAYFFVTATFPLMAAKDIEKRKLFKRSLVLLLVGVLGLIVGTQIMAPFAVRMLGGAEFEPAIIVLRILILASFFSYLSHLFGFTLIARGGQKEMLKLGVVALSFNLIANYVFIQKYGIYGASWVTVATEMLGTVGMGWFLLKRSKT